MDAVMLAEVVAWLFALLPFADLGGQAGIGRIIERQAELLVALCHIIGFRGLDIALYRSQQDRRAHRLGGEAIIGFDQLAGRGDAPLMRNNGEWAEDSES